MGQIGEKGFRAFLRHGNVAKVPILMEVPIDDRRKDEENMKLVRRLIGA
jgi:endonuclease IV